MIQIGDSLVLANGELDKVMNRTEYQYTGKVWNVAPQAGSQQNNLVIAQGYLNGSARYQDGSVKDMNRLLSRGLIDSKILD